MHISRALAATAAFCAASVLTPVLLDAQLFTLTREQMIQYTAQNPFDRFPDGRPKVPDALIERARGLSAEEVFAVLPGKGFRNQYEDGFHILHPGKKLVGHVLLGLLVLLSAAFGAAAGLLLVYSTDLPQVDALEHYRPSSVTELYDDHGRVIGTFALQRRVIATYDDYPQVLRDAPEVAEDFHVLPRGGEARAGFHLILEAVELPVDLAGIDPVVEDRHQDQDGKQAAHRADATVPT